MSKYGRIVILGDGGWGTALAILLFHKGYAVTLWSAFKDYAKFLEKKRVNKNFLPGIKIPKKLSITSELSCLRNADLIILAVPSQYLRRVLLKGARYYQTSVPVVSVVKGIENGTLLRVSEVVRDIWHARNICVLSGPTIAMEVARGIPTTVVAASVDKRLREDVQGLFMTPAFRVYTNSDVVGVELGGSLKNIIAIACGISDGLKFGTNTKAAILTRGLVEMARLGVKCGAKKETFFGVAGLGDLATTCFNALSRNHYLGQRIGQGDNLKKVLRSMKMVAEGVSTTRAVFALANKNNVDMPITREIYKVLYKNKSVKDTVKHLMCREKKTE
jgi:glycerol-3-phosphate dehydrogenase (NAD(P)+)